ncbi:MAG: class I SAM-dependent methyltransferase [Elusimicrobiota bacterium]
MSEQSGHIYDGSLLCGGCASSFPVEEGVPNLLIVRDNKQEKVMAKGFEYEWNLFFKKDKPYFKEMFLEWVTPLKPEDFRDKVVLDAGCGMGRNTMVCGSFSPKAVIGMDIHDGVKVLFENSKSISNMHVVKADIFHLPFKTIFDAAYSIGVIHHTPDPTKAFNSLASVLKPSGMLSVFVYGREKNTLVADHIGLLRVKLFSRLPNTVLLALSKVLGLVLFAYLRYIFCPLIRVFPAVRRNISYSDYFLWLNKTDIEYCVHVVFDHLVTPIASYHSTAELVNWYGSNGFSDVKIWNRYNITHVGFGRKSRE